MHAGGVASAPGIQLSRESSRKDRTAELTSRDRVSRIAATGVESSSQGFAPMNHARATSSPPREEIRSHCTYANRKRSAVLGSALAHISGALPSLVPAMRRRVSVPARRSVVALCRPWGGGHSRVLGWGLDYFISFPHSMRRQRSAPVLCTHPPDADNPGNAMRWGSSRGGGARAIAGDCPWRQLRSPAELA